jgi:hypothetical protein
MVSLLRAPTAVLYQFWNKTTTFNLWKGEAGVMFDDRSYAPINVNPVGGEAGTREGMWQKYEKTNQMLSGGGGENSGQIKVTFPTHGRRATYFKLFKNTNLLINIE